MLRLPKDVDRHPKLAALEAYFSVPSKPLVFDDKMRQALRAVFGTGHLVQGLEAIETLLDREKKGIDSVREKTGQTPSSQRMSRLVFLATDGSDRFERHAEAMLSRHADRVHAVRIAADSEALGAALTAKGNPAKALMIADRKALGLFLAALAALL